MGITTLVSVNSAGTNSGNRRSFAPVISADGRFVAFVSKAGNLVATDNNSGLAPAQCPTWADCEDIFVRGPLGEATETTTLVSVNGRGTDSGNDQVIEPQTGRAAMSPDGRFVAFMSFASDLVPPGIDTNGTIDGCRIDKLCGDADVITAAGTLPATT